MELDFILEVYENMISSDNVHSCSLRCNLSCLRTEGTLVCLFGLHHTADHTILFHS